MALCLDRRPNTSSVTLLSHLGQHHDCFLNLFFSVLNYWKGMTNIEDGMGVYFYDLKVMFVLCSSFSSELDKHHKIRWDGYVSMHVLFSQTYISFFYCSGVIRDVMYLSHGHYLFQKVLYLNHIEVIIGYNIYIHSKLSYVPLAINPDVYIQFMYCLKDLKPGNGTPPLGGLKKKDLKPY